VRIRKISITKDKKVNVEYEARNKKGGMDEFHMLCDDEPRPELRKALDAMAVHVVDLCEFPDDYVDRVSVRGVSYSFGGEKEVMGATITGSLKLKYSNCPLNINTPHKASESYSDTPVDADLLLSDECCAALADLSAEAALYVDGDRMQTKLDLKPKSGKK
jgi:hypothetical protein